MNDIIASKPWRIAWWMFFAVCLLTIVAIRIRLLGIPLERDEGEYAYAGQLMLQGIPPYRLAYNMKFPGTYAAYALLMSIFGQSTAGIHLGLLVINLATIALLFFLGRRFFGEVGGLAAAASYAVLSMSPDVFGFAAHASQFVMLAVVGGAVVLLRALETRSRGQLFASGLLFGIAVLMKQTGAVFVLFALFHLILVFRRMRFGLRAFGLAMFAFSSGVFLPLALTCLVLWYVGVFGTFWFWCVQYAREYAVRISWSIGGQWFVVAIQGVIAYNALIWALAVVGFGAMLWKRLPGRSFLIAFFVAGSIATAAGLYFRGHYFIFILPAVSLFAAAAARGLRQFSLGKILVLPIFVAATALPIVKDADFFFAMPLDAASRLAYGINPFIECVRVAQFLREHTQPNETIAVVGSEPEIYFYAQRHSATGYIYTYPLMEPQPFAARMQQEMIREIENSRPAYVVFVGLESSWLMVPESNRAFFDWFKEYSTSELKPAGLVDIVSLTHTDYYFPYDGAPESDSRFRIFVYERKL